MGSGERETPHIAQLMTRRDTSAMWRLVCLRVRCDRRCEAVTMVEPTGYPMIGFYCGLHSYQRPRGGGADSLIFDDAVVEEFIRKCTSFVAPEANLAAELAKAPGLIRDRPGASRSIVGAAVLNWLTGNRKMTEEAAINLARRMVQYDALQPLDGTRVFSNDRNALYRVLYLGKAV